VSTISWLGPLDGPEALPSPSQALSDPNGLLAAGGSLQPNWLLRSYEHGIFPWYEEGQPILWWCPNPRAVLKPDELKISRSLRRTLNKQVFAVTADRAFPDVVRACAAPRSYTDATWITHDMAEAYCRLHALGWAHSFEAWENNELAGGLYGVGIGRVFFGESMFTKRTDASKIAFVHAVRFLAQRGVEMIDCQIRSAHLIRLGATEIPRDEFIQRLRIYCRPRGTPGPWTEEFEGANERSQ